MYLDLTESQQMFRAAARNFLSEACPLQLVRQLEEHPDAHPSRLWQQLVGLGWTGLVIPEKYGGLGGSFSDLVVLLEETGRALLPGPFFSTVVLFCLPLLSFSSEGQNQEILEQVATGQVTGSLALTESSGSYHPSDIQTFATKKRNQFSLTGTKLFVTDAVISDYLLVAAVTNTTVDKNDSISLFLVKMGTNNVWLSQLDTLAKDRQSQVIFDKTVVPAANILGGLHQGWALISQTLEWAAVAKCAEILGSSQAILEMVVDYTKQRTQFGKPIGSFQAIQHYCADIASDIEGARLITYKAAWKISCGEPSHIEASQAKLWVSSVASRLVYLAHQCFGAIGFTADHDLQLFTRRLKVGEIMFGDAHFHALKIANLLEL